MSDAVLIQADLAEARAKTKDVREQLRALGDTLRSLSDDVEEQSPAAFEKLERARINVARAIEAVPCTDGGQGPF